MHLIALNGQSIFIFSDTHGKHRLVDIPSDIHIAIHCGDMCNSGDMNELVDFFQWYASLDIPHKIVVHGNHDLPFELEPEEHQTLVPASVHWLNDQSVSIGGVRIRGISASPFFSKNIAPNAPFDIIVSHYPPYGILDEGWGSKEIRDFVVQYSPQYHLFGHHHATGGKTAIHHHTQYINASIFHTLCP